jgi:hypothetical protein
MWPRRGKEVGGKDSIQDDAMMTFGRRRLRVRKIKLVLVKAKLLEVM